MAISPNYFELKGDGTTITYSSSSTSGQPQLNYENGTTSVNASGGELQTSSNSLGTLVTLTLEVVPDGWTRSLTVLIPPVNLQDERESTDVKSLSVESTHKSSIGGPDLVVGQVLTYDTVLSLTGTAKLVQF